MRSKQDFKVFYDFSTNAMGSNCTAAWKSYKNGAHFANSCYVQIHPTCIPVTGDHQSKLTLMSESLRNDGRIWVPKKKEDAQAIAKGKKTALDIFSNKKTHLHPNFRHKKCAKKLPKIYNLPNENDF